MKKLYNILIVIGVLLFFGIIAISAISDVISDQVKTYGFIILGYLGVILFTYGWVKRFGKE